MSNLVGFVTFAILFRNFPSINGWSMYGVLFLYGFALVALTPVQCFFDNNWNLRYAVKTGDFIKYCFRPINIFFYYISEVFDVKGLGQLCFGVGTLVFAWHHLAIPVTVSTVVQTVLFLFAASLFMIAIMNFAAATCFLMKSINVLRDNDNVFTFFL